MSIRCARDSVRLWRQFEGNASKVLRPNDTNGAGRASVINGTGTVVPAATSIVTAGPEWSP